MNKLLDNLDTNVGDAVENQAEMFDGVYSAQGVGGESSVDDILAKRGLLNDDDDDDDDHAENDQDSEEEGGGDGEDEDEDDGDKNDGENGGGGEDVEQQDEESDGDLQGSEEVEVTEDKNENVGDDQDDDDDDEVVFQVPVADNDNNNDKMLNNGGIQMSETTAKTGDMIEADSEENLNANGEKGHVFLEATEGKTSSSGESGESGDKNPSLDPSHEEEENQSSLSSPPPPPPLASTTSKTASHQQQQQKLKETERMVAELKKQLKEQKQLTAKAKKETTTANKETRKLRRTVVKLNAELDSAERELDAQRTELERAAVRMDKERVRYKEDKERLEYGHKEDMKALMEEHKSSIDAMVSSHAEQMVDMEERIKRAEEARAKEGGDMSLELAEAAERERETLKKVMGLEEEKSTLMSQIASLNTQMGALQSRVESLQEAAEVATEHEREADDRLDAALSLHARQLGQRQAREAELERTIADIAAALVVARQREAQEANGAPEQIEESNGNVVELKEKLVAAEDEIEVFKTQLMLERQKSVTLQKELEDISKERTQELSSSLAKQKQHDRRVSDLTSTVTQLQSKLRSLKHPGNTINEDDDSEDNIAFAHFQAKEHEYKKQISSLSEDLLRQRGRLENTSTEVLTLRNRLRAALNRAEAAEKEARASTVIDHRYDIERGPIGNSYNNKTRRRFGPRTKKSATIRSALKLDSGTGETREAIAGSIDSLDFFTVKMLNVLRSDPFARIFLIVYLVVLHLWTFCLIAFHAHGTLEPSANVGPEQLLKHSYRHMEQVHSNTP